MPREIRNPVVLIHGFGDVPGLSGTWAAVEEVLREEARVPERDILSVQVSPIGSIKDRSRSAIDRIAEKFSGKSVHLIAHSMGGLNARDIAARDNLGFTVLTVTTFGTPHYGVKALEANGFASALAKILPALVDMKPSIVAEFNKSTRVNASVKYFTWAGECAFGTVLFAATWPFTRPYGATDCVINVDSAKWDPDYCTQLGVINGADHFTILRKKTMRYTVPHLKAAENGTKAPVVVIENDLVSAIGNRIEGDIHTVMAPVKAFFSWFS